MTRPLRGGARTTRVLALVGMAGPGAYLVLVTVLGLLEPGYDLVRQTQSELGASDAAHAGWMNVGGFSALGVVILAFGLAYVRVIVRSAWRTAAVVLLVLAGVGMVLVGGVPCDPGCVDVTATGRTHGLLSMPGAIGLPGAMMVSAAAFGVDGRFGVTWQLASFWVGLLSLLAGPVIQAEVLPEVDGLLQRAAMWPALVWMAAVSARFLVLAARREN